MNRKGQLEINFGAAGLAVLGGFIGAFMTTRVEGTSIFITVATFLGTAVLSYIIANGILNR